MLIRPVVQSDQPKIKELFHSDVYHWSQWVRPILQYGIVGFFVKPIVCGISSICVIGYCWDVELGLLLMMVFLIGLVILYLVKVALFMRYFRMIPEFANNQLAVFYSQKGYAFYVAEIEGKIVGCVGVQKRQEQVHINRYRMWVRLCCRRVGGMKVKEEFKFVSRQMGWYMVGLKRFVHKRL